MKALHYERYGPPEVLEFREVEKPTPGRQEVRVRVHATTVNRTDNATIRGIPFFARLITGVWRPKWKIPGSEFAGIVDAVGEAVTAFKVGDRVFGFNDLGACAHAEYLVIAEEFAVTMPEGCSFGQAAASVEGAHYAYNCINKLTLQPGDAVLVYGATGAIGSAAVQLLKYFQATVTAVCATPHLELVKALGADRVVDYLREDFTHSEQRYRLVVDAVGKVSFFQCKHLLEPGGVYVSTDLGHWAQNIFLPLFTPFLKFLWEHKYTLFPWPENKRRSLLLIRKLMVEGRFKAVIDRTYPLDQIIEAYRYVGTGQKIGNVVISLE